MVNALQVMPIAINAQVRYRGYDFDILTCCGHHILRVKQIHRGIAACVASDKNVTHGIPDRLLWIPVQDLEPLTLSELRQVFQPSSPVEESAPLQLQAPAPSPDISMTAASQSQDQPVTPPKPPSQPRPTPAGFGIPSVPTPSTARVQTQMPVAIVPRSLAPQVIQQMSISGSQPPNPQTPNSQRRVLINQSDQMQRKLWRFALKSQGVTVIMADPAQPLMEQIEAHQPHLLIQEMNTTQFNPYEFCRECRVLKLKLAIILTHSSERAIVDGEKRWATSQGAADIIADLRPTVEALIPSVVYVLGRLGLPSPNMEDLRQSLTPARSTAGGPVTSGSQPLWIPDSEQSKPEPRSGNLLTGLFQTLGLASKKAEKTSSEQNEGDQEASSPQEPQSFWHRKLW